MHDSNHLAAVNPRNSRPRRAFHWDVFRARSPRIQSGEALGTAFAAVRPVLPAILSWLYTLPAVVFPADRPVNPVRVEASHGALALPDLAACAMFCIPLAGVFTLNLSPPALPASTLVLSSVPYKDRAQVFRAPGAWMADSNATPDPPLPPTGSRLRVRASIGSGAPGG